MNSELRRMSSWCFQRFTSNMIQIETEAISSPRKEAEYYAITKCLTFLKVYLIANQHIAPLFKLTYWINFKASLIFKIVSISVSLFLQLYRDHREQGLACLCKKKKKPNSIYLYPGHEGKPDYSKLLGGMEPKFSL